ncbi:MAG: PKD domain-containing protein, partial [Bacteroidales bacterium]|nr:PKD domain-containing protein [Bacteroidales bacterium]
MIIKKTITSIVFLLLSFLGFSQNTGIIYPKNQSVLSDTLILLSWNTCTDADNYSIVIAKSNSINIIVQEDNILASSKAIILPGQGKYYISVIGYDDAIEVCHHNIEMRVFIPYVNDYVSGCFFSDSVVSSSGSVVNTWIDLSANSNNAISLSTVNNPICKLNNTVLNVDSLILFDGINDYFIVSNVEIAAAYGIFNWAGSQSFFPNYNGLISKNAVTNPSLIFVGNGSNSSSLFRNDAGKAFFGNNIYIDGIQTREFAPFNDYKIVSGKSLTSAFFSELIIGGANGIAGRYWDGNVAELIFYNTTPSDSINNLTIDYLRNKYAPLVNLGKDIIISDTYCDTSLNAYQPWFVSYNWSTGATDSIIKVSETGIYHITATDIFGFTSHDSIYVEFPIISLSNVSFCAFDSLTIFTGLSTSDFNFLWSDGTSGDSLLLFEAGLYNLTVSDLYGCSYITNNFEVLLDSFPFKVDIPDLSLCAGNTLTTSYPYESFSDYLFVWSTGSNDSIITINSSGEYSVTITNNNGCVGIDTCNITVVGVSPECDFYFDTVCFNTSTSFIDASIPASSAANDQIASYTWDFDGLGTSIDSNPVFLFPNEGVYNVNLTIISDAGCYSSVNKNVIVKSNPIAAFEVNPACINVELNFINLSDSVSGYENIYLWNFNNESTSTLINPTYSFSSSEEVAVELLAFSANGCSDSLTQNIDINSFLPHPQSFSLISPPNNIFTFKNELEFFWNNSDNAFSYELHLISDSQDFSYLSDSNSITVTLPSAGIYSWYVTSYNYCQDFIVSDTFNINLLSHASFSDVAFWYSPDSISELGNILYDLSSQNNDAVLVQPYESTTYYQTPILNHATLSFDGNSAYKLQDSALISTLFAVLNWNTDVTNFPYYNGLLTKLDATEFPAIIIQGDGINTSSDIRVDANKTLFESNIYLNQINDNDFSPLNQVKLFFGQMDGHQNFGDLLIGSASLMPNRFWNGQVGDIIAFSNPVNDSVQNVIYQYLRHKYSPPVNLSYDIRIPYNFCDTAITTAYKPWFTDYVWSTGETDSIIHVNKPGLYSVTVTDIFGFTSSDDIRVFYPVVNEFTDTLVCFGESLIWDLELAGDYTYEWYGSSETTRAITINAEGQYAAIITDTLGCQYKTDTINFSFDNYELTTSIGPADTTLCAGNRLLLVSNANETVQWQWNTNETSPEIVLATTGEYSVTTTNWRGCVAIDTISVIINGVVPVPAFETLGHCDKNPVYFTDLSTSVAGTINSWSWSINGVQFSTEQNPQLETLQLEILQLGINTISLSISTDDHCNDFLTQDLTIYPLPVPSFTPLLVCTNTEIEFTSTSTVGGG